MGARAYWTAPILPLMAADGTPVTATSLTDATPNGVLVGPTTLLGCGPLELGTKIRLHAQGELTLGSTADTLTLGFYYGGVAGVALAAGAALAIGAVSETSAPWEMDYEGEIRAVGTSGSIKGMGTVAMPGSGTGLATVQAVYPIPQTAAARVVAIDTTTARC